MELSGLEDPLDISYELNPEVENLYGIVHEVDQVLGT